MLEALERGTRSLMGLDRGEDCNRQYRGGQDRSWGIGDEVLLAHGVSPVPSYNGNEIEVIVNHSDSITQRSLGAAVIARACFE